MELAKDGVIVSYGALWRFLDRDQRRSPFRTILKIADDPVNHSFLTNFETGS